MASGLLSAVRIVQEDALLRQAVVGGPEHGRLDRTARSAELARELGISPGALADYLLELGIGPTTAPAFEALPLAEVAWADGEVDWDERWRVLGVATAFGLELGRPAHAQLELWLSRRPEPALFEAWIRLAGVRRANRASTRRLQEGAREVAAASGGILGFAATSAAERAVIGRIEQALEASATEPTTGDA